MFVVFFTCALCIVEEYTKAERLNGPVFKWTNVLTIWKSVLDKKKIFWDSKTNDILVTDDLNYREIIKAVVANYTTAGSSVNKMLCQFLKDNNMTNADCEVYTKDDAPKKEWTESANDKYWLELFGLKDKALPGFTVTETDQMFSQAISYAALLIPFVVFFVICFVYYFLYCFSCCCCCSCCCCKAKDRRKPNIVLSILMIISSLLLFVSAMFYAASIGKLEDMMMYVRDVPDKLNQYIDQLTSGVTKFSNSGPTEIENDANKVLDNVTGLLNNVIGVIDSTLVSINRTIDEKITQTTTGHKSGSLLDHFGILNGYIQEANTAQPAANVPEVNTSQIQDYVTQMQSSLSDVQAQVNDFSSFTDTIKDLKTMIHDQICNLSDQIKPEELRKTIDESFMNSLNKTWTDYEVTDLFNKGWASIKAVYFFPAFIILVMFASFVLAFFSSCCCSRCIADSAPCCPCICNICCLVFGILFTLVAFVLLLLAQVCFTVFEYSLGDAYSVALPEPIEIPPINITSLIQGYLNITVDPIKINNITLAPGDIPLATTFLDAGWNVGFSDMFLVSKILPLASLKAPIDSSSAAVTSSLSNSLEKMANDYIDPFMTQIDEQKGNIQEKFPTITDTQYQQIGTDLAEKIKTELNTINTTVIDGIFSSLSDIISGLPRNVANSVKNGADDIIFSLTNFVSVDLFKIINTIPGFILKEPINIFRRYIMYDLCYMFIMLSISAFFTMVSLFFILLFLCIRRPGLGSYTKMSERDSEFSSSTGTSYSTSRSRSDKKHKKKKGVFSSSESDGVVTVKFTTKKDQKKKNSSSTDSSSSAGIANTGKNKNFASSSSNSSSSSSSSDDEGKSTYL